MAKQPKLPKRLFKSKDVVHVYQHDRESKMGMKQMTRDHLDVLQNIEFALVNSARRDQSIDDRMVDAALNEAIQPGAANEQAKPQIEMICARLDQMRAIREDVSDEIWQAGLRTVRDSVRRHSDLQPGEKAYLQFVSQYVR
jgi:hypothetical protein